MNKSKPKPLRTKLTLTRETLRVIAGAAPIGPNHTDWCTVPSDRDNTTCGTSGMCTVKTFKCSNFCIIW